MAMLLILAGVALVAWLPGAVFFRLPLLDRQRRAGLPVEERFFWSVVLSAAWSSAIVLGLAAFDRYTLRALTVIDAGVAVSAAAVFRRRLVLGRECSRAGRAAALPVVIVALACLHFVPPFERILGGKDPGVYLSEGIQIAQRGSLVVRDPFVSALPQSVRDLYFPVYLDVFGKPLDYSSLRFMGFFVVDPGRGTVVGQFPHLFPAWIAVAYGLAGVRGALAVTPLAAILGLLAVYFAGARLIGRWAAFAGTLLLALNVAFVWFAREPNSEVVTLALLFAALLAFARCQVDEDRFFGPVAGVLYGLLLFARFDTVLALAGLSIAIVLQLVQGRRPPWMFLAPLAVLLALAWLYLTGVMAPYSALPRVFIANLRPQHLALLAAGGGALAAIVLVARHGRVADVVGTIAPRVLVVVVLVAAFYAYFLRVPVYGRLAFGDARSLEIFSWYFPPLALALALVGFALAAWTRFWRAPALFLTVAVYGFFFFYKLHVVHEHFWAARRFVPVILPAASLMATAGLSLTVSMFGPSFRRLALAAAVAVVAMLAVTSARASWPVVRHVEHAGAVQHVEQLARQFDAKDLVVFEAREAGSDLHAVGLPLAYVWNRQVAVLTTVKPDKRLFRQFLDWALGHYHNVYFVGGGGTDLVSPSFGVAPLANERFELPEYESRPNGYPHEVRRKKFDFAVYRLGGSRPDTSAFTLDIGGFDDLNVVRFHAKEQVEGVRFRWSAPSSFVSLPPIPLARKLTLWASDGGRPVNAAPAHVEVYANDRLLGAASVSSGPFTPYTFPIPAGVMAPSSDADSAVTVRLVSNTWKPRDFNGGSDDRDLGVMISRVEVR